MESTIINFEIPAAYVENLNQFYAGVFGWNIAKYPGPIEYWMIQAVPIDDKGMLVRPGVNCGRSRRKLRAEAGEIYFS